MNTRHFRGWPKDFLRPVPGAPLFYGNIAPAGKNSHRLLWQRDYHAGQRDIKAAAALKQMGVEKGDRVIVYLQIPHFVSVFGIMRANAVLFKPYAVEHELSFTSRQRF